MDVGVESFVSSALPPEDAIRVIIALADAFVSNPTPSSLPYLSAAIALFQEDIRSNGDKMTVREWVDSHWKLSTYLSARAQSSESWEQDMLDAISCSRKAVQASSDWPDRLRAGLTSELSQRFLESSRRMADPIAHLQIAIEHGESALALVIRAQDPQQLPTCHCNLATCYGDLSRYSSDEIALNRAIDLATEGVTLAKAVSDPDLSLWTSTLGILHFHRYISQGYRDTEIQKALEYGELAVDSMDEDDPRSSQYMNNLTVILNERWRRGGGKDVLDMAVHLGERAVLAVKDRHLASLCRANLSEAHRCRYLSALHSEDLTACFKYAEIAADPTNEGDPNFFRYQSNLALAHLARFESDGDITDAERAISLGTAAIESTPSRHESRPDLLTSLASYHRAHYERSGATHNLDKAILYANLAIDSHSSSTTVRPSCFSNLALHYYERFDRLRNTSDVNEAIKHGTTATRLISRGQPDFIAIHSNLFICYAARFGRLHERSDIEEALRLAEICVNSAKEGDIGLSTFYGNLAALHFDFYEAFPSEHKSLHMAIENATFALNVPPSNAYSQATQHGILAASYFQRYLHVGRSSEDLSLAISHGTAAVDSTAADAVQLCSHQAELAQFHLVRFQNPMLGTPDDAEKAALLFIAVMKSEIGDPMVCFKSSRQGAEFLSSIDPQLALTVYSYAFSHLFRLVTFGSNLDARQEILASATPSSLSSDAASFAIATKQYERAVEFLEAGRSILFSQQLQLRSQFDELAKDYPELAQSLKNVAALLERGAHSKLSMSDFRPHEKVPDDLERVGQLHRQNARDWDALLKQVREIPQFKRFLRPRSFEEITSACTSWPVVILNIGTLKSDALVVKGPDLITRVPLCDVLFKEAQKLNAEMGAIVKSSGRNTRADRRLGPKSQTVDKRLRDILKKLWTLVVQPVITHLGLQKSDSPPRIWWSLTAQLSSLPIHAAGIYDTAEGPNAPQFMISSYAPTLGTLSSRSSSSPLKFVAIGVRQGHKGSELPNATAEIERIGELFTTDTGARPAWLNLLADKEANVSNVIAALQRCTLAHIACHGMQDPIKPLECSLVLHDNDLSLARILEESLPDGDLVFLSACQTALGDAKLTGEALHLAGGLLFAGFRRAIATLWGVDDSDCPKVAEMTYTRLTSASGEPNGVDAANALHSAILELRHQHGVSLFRWVPFVHIGL